ncbi:hypothetical protein [Akkermansia massiliensis]|uniref:hypothetical protein n=1 Tax=Akkermansia massiliensis TaxID=2927224 RepID=UPI00202EE567|nr:hypothetical protein [Akkermansia sp. B2-R-115]MCM0684583.1 hypothetical protein [Akkermansia sp. B2-R-115]
MNLTVGKSVNNGRNEDRCSLAFPFGRAGAFFSCPLSAARQNDDFYSGNFLNAVRKYFSGQDQKILKIGMEMIYF